MSIMKKNKSDDTANSNKHKKSDVTRKKILNAARKVFAQNSYNAASIRMIANEGEFEFGLIRYYFPNKAALFETVMKSIYEELTTEFFRWHEGIQKMPVEDGFSVFLDRFIKYHLERSEALKIIMNNIYMPEDPDTEVPGYHYIPKLLKQNRKNLEKILRFRASKEEIDRFSDSINVQVLMFLGASTCNAKVVGLPPDSKQYQQWVKETLMYIFLPHLKKLIFQ